MTKLDRAALLERAARVRLVLTDCDGVLTDAGVWYGAEGEVLKRFSMRDGMGVGRLRRAGLETGILTGEDSPAVQARARKLRITELHGGLADKLTRARDICARRGITLDEIAYIGDDVNDLELLAAAGLSAAPADAEPEVRDVVHVVLGRKGGHGAFREFAELVLAGRTEMVALPGAADHAPN